MKLLWLCNMIPAVIRQHISGVAGTGLWVDHVLEDLRKREDISLHVLCLGVDNLSGKLDDRCSYGVFSQKQPYQYLPELEQRFSEELETFRPDVIHIWGTEFAHTLAMVNAAEKKGLLDQVAVSIQGLCSVCARHYTEGVPQAWVNCITFRDLLRWDNIRQQQKKFARRGALEVQALQKVHHVIGRTEWDYACTRKINPESQYHFCNETLRPVFYSGQWNYSACRKHRIFASSCAYPVKGFHYLLEAFAQVVKSYPDATLAVPGAKPCAGGLNRKIRINSYELYLHHLMKKYGIEDKVEYIGSLSAEEMKEAYLSSNVFVLPSTIENSPNSMGEAMLLGVPCVASDVGGVSTMLRHDAEGYIYQSTAPYMLAHYIQQVFAMEDRAAALGEAARIHARTTHSPEKNLKDLLDIYEKIAK